MKPLRKTIRYYVLTNAFTYDETAKKKPAHLHPFGFETRPHQHHTMWSLLLLQFPVGLPRHSPSHSSLANIIMISLVNDFVEMITADNVSEVDRRPTSIANKQKSNSSTTTTKTIAQTIIFADIYLNLVRTEDFPTANKFHAAGNDE